jgi:hypothetical protein
MTAVTTEPVLDEFDLDIQIDDTGHPGRTYSYVSPVTAAISCTWCCPSRNCTEYSELFCN